MRILVVCFKFPPMSGVGSRRWVKLSKALIKKGHEVHFLTVDYPYSGDLSWLDDVHEKLIVHRYQSVYPSRLLKDGAGIIGKLLTRAFRVLLSKTFFRYGEAQHDTARIVVKIKEIISEHDIKNIIASGHPVSVNYAASIVKCDIPSINLIQDFRDNWNDLESFSFPMGISRLKAKEVFVDEEFRSVYYANSIVNVTDTLTSVMTNRHSSQPASKFHTIFNFYDEDEVVIDDSIRDKGLTIRYFGSLYNERIEAVYKVMDALFEIPDIADDFIIELYTNYDCEKIPKKYSSLINTSIYFKSMVPPSEVKILIGKSFACLSINAAHASYAFGTKVFEYMGQEKPIFHISNGGELSAILEQTGNVVATYNKDSIRESLLALHRRYLIGPTERKGNDLFARFSLAAAANKFEALLK